MNIFSAGKFFQTAIDLPGLKRYNVCSGFFLRLYYHLMELAIVAAFVSAVITFVCVWIGTGSIALAWASFFALGSIYAALEETK